MSPRPIGKGNLTSPDHRPFLRASVPLEPWQQEAGRVGARLTPEVTGGPAGRGLHLPALGGGGVRTETVTGVGTYALSSCMRRPRPVLSVASSLALIRRIKSGREAGAPSPSAAPAAPCAIQGSRPLRGERTGTACWRRRGWDARPGVCLGPLLWSWPCCWVGVVQGIGSRECVPLPGDPGLRAPTAQPLTLPAGRRVAAQCCSLQCPL